jgi:hypothetical protein
LGEGVHCTAVFTRWEHLRSVRRQESPAISGRANQLWQILRDLLSLDLTITSQVERERDQIPMLDRLAQMVGSLHLGIASLADRSDEFGQRPVVTFGFNLRQAGSKCRSLPFLSVDTNRAVQLSLGV